MLVELSIQDFVIIERATLALGSGLTVVSGATGDGKTLVLKALRFLLGERAVPERTVRAGAERALVEGLFRIESPSLRAELRELAAPLQDSGWDEPELILSRSVEPDGRGRVRVGGRLATVTELRRVGERLVDMLSQHEYQSLARPERQREMLDALGGARELAAAFTSGRTRLRELAAERDALALAGDEARAREAAARSLLAELEGLAPVAGELEELERERTVLANIDAIRGTADAGHERLAERDGAALDLVRTTVRELEAHAGSSAELDRIARALEAVSCELAAAAADLARERDRIDRDPGRLAPVEERIEAYRDLARRLSGAPPRKGVCDPHSLAARLQELEAELGPERNPGERLSVLDREIAARGAELEARGERLSRARRAAARKLEASVQATLVELALGDARVSVEVSPLERGPPATAAAPALEAVSRRFPAPSGLDRVEIRFAGTPGLAPLPLREVASGGELARVCLALKRALAEFDDVALLVFDEVDQNVGGRLGAAIGRTLLATSAARQVLAVTHLPSVAGFATEHFLVEKTADKAGSRTTVRRLDREGRVTELALMMNGDPVTDAALEQARELLAPAATKAAPPAPAARTVRARLGRKRPRARPQSV